MIQEKEADCISRRSQVEDNRRTRACGSIDGERVEEDERRHREEQGAVALSLALTEALLLLLRASHPPAGATVLIISLGLLTKPIEMTMIMVGVAILTVARWVINRALGMPVPAWVRRS